MEDFKNQVANIASNIKNLESNVLALEERIQRKLSSVLLLKEENQMIREIKAIEHIFRETSQKIKEELQDMEYQNTINQSTSTQAILFQESRKSHWLALTIKLKKLCAQFNNIQANYKAKEEQKLVNQYLIENPNITVKEIQTRIKNNDEQYLQHKEYTKAQVRHKEIKRIAETINELCVFLDELHAMVKQQRSSIDRIEVKMTGSLDTTTKAKKSLVTAYKYQIKKTKMVKFFVYLLAIFLFFVLLYFFYRYKSGERYDKPKFDNRQYIY
ncbi:hypothetical protein BDAP_002738 [Binucleata daphniae]